MIMIRGPSYHQMPKGSMVQKVPALYAAIFSFKWGSTLYTDLERCQNTVLSAMQKAGYTGVCVRTRLRTYICLMCKEPRTGTVVISRVSGRPIAQHLEY